MSPQPCLYNCLALQIKSHVQHNNYCFFMSANNRSKYNIPAYQLFIKINGRVQLVVMNLVNLIFDETCIITSMMLAYVVPTMKNHLKIKCFQSIVINSFLFPIELTYFLLPDESKFIFFTENVICLEVGRRVCRASKYITFSVKNIHLDS